MLFAAMLLAAGRITYAQGSWATFDRDSECVAVSRAQRVTADRAAQASVEIGFDRAGARTGQLAVRLGHTPRRGSDVLLTIGDRPFQLIARDALAWSKGALQETAILGAMRTAEVMRVEGRSAAGGRFVDVYLLDGAPGAIDAAAAACAVHR